MVVLWGEEREECQRFTGGGGCLPFFAHFTPPLLFLSPHTHTDERDFISDDAEPSAPAPRRRRPPAPRARRARGRTAPSSSEDDDDDGASSSENEDDLSSGEDDDRAAPRGASPASDTRPPAPVPLPASTLAAAAAAERVLAVNPAADAFHVKLRWTSHRATVWVPGADLRAARPALARAALSRAPSLSTDSAAATADDDADPDDDGWAAELKDGVHPDWVEIDRVIGETSIDDTTALLVKWEGLGYAEATWEWEADLTRDGDGAAVAAFRAREAAPPPAARAPAPATLDAVPPFLNARALRDYQVASLRWMVRARAEGRNVILGDEMGLGKTAQSTAALWWQKHYGRGGPFLVVAPLTTLGHWAREMRTWTPMNVVVYVGSAADRAACRETEWWRHGESPWDESPSRARSARPSAPKFDVLLTSYETLRTDAAWLGDKAVTWQTVVVDEAHRLKTAASATRAALTTMDANRRVKWMLLLTGTPVQNNMRELHGLLNVLNPAHAAWCDERAFFARYGGAPSGPPPTPSQIAALQADLSPVLLRRMKEDVEKGLPAKEEVVVRVELTREQRQYYRAIYERRVDALLAGGGKANLPNLRNLAMELRKVCCHPWLCGGLEADSRARAEAAGRPSDELQALVAASGKMVLLSKLLPKLRAEGRKVREKGWREAGTRNERRSRARIQPNPPTPFSIHRSSSSPSSR